MRSVLAIFLYVACVLTAQAGNMVIVGKSINTAVLDTATADSCAPTLREHFSRHSIYRVLPRLSGHYALITQEFDVGRGCFESFFPAMVTVNAKPIDAKSGRVGIKKLWSFTTAGVYGEVEDGNLWGLYRVDMPGCCGASRTSKYFSLETGKLVGSTTTGPMLEICFIDRYDPQGVVESRFISIEDNIASSPQAPTKAIATIFYADRKVVKETFSISGESKLGNEDWWLSELTFLGQKAPTENLALSGSGEFQIHIGLKCRCDEQPLDIVVPASINGLDVNSAIVTGPKGISLTKVPYRPSSGALKLPDSK